MREALKTGAWLTGSRLRLYPTLMLALLLTAVVLLCVTGHGENDAFGRPLGMDFSEIWVAGVEVDQGHPAQPYDNAAHFAAQKDRFGAGEGYYVWPYPPYFLGLAALLGLLPYLVALALWQGSTLIAYLACLFGVLRRESMSPKSGSHSSDKDMLQHVEFAPILVDQVIPPDRNTRARLAPVAISIAALGFPAVFINLAHGQNGFLTAALLTAGLLALDRRPVLAGLLFALLAYKPHLGLVIPVALLAAGAWRAIAAATLGVGAMTLATIAAFGTATWQGFFAGLAFTRTVILEQGGLSYEKVQSVFAALRLLGAPLTLAYAAQAIVTAAAIVALFALWHSRADARLKAAALLVASLIATPYVLDYDMVVLAPALAFALSYGLQHGFGPYERSALALIWVTPLLARPLGSLALPIGALVMLGFLAGLMHRALRDRSLPASVPAAPAAN